MPKFTRFERPAAGDEINVPGIAPLRNKLKKGVLNTQGVVRFSEFDTGVTFAIAGGTGKYKKAHGTLRAKSRKFT